METIYVGRPRGYSVPGPGVIRRGRQSQRWHWNKYVKHHQNTRECERRLRQVRAGQLSGRCGPRLRSNFVSNSARLKAIGLSYAEEVTLIDRIERGRD